MFGKSISIMLEDHETLGRIFVLRVNNNDAAVFDVKNLDGVIDEGQLTVRISKETAMAIVQYIDDSMDEENKTAMEVRV